MGPTHCFSSRNSSKSVRSSMRHRFSLFAAVLLIVAAAAAQSNAVPEAQLDPPIVQSHVDAVYPPSALAERRHADVVLAVTVDVDGHVSKIDVVESGGDDL